MKTIISFRLYSLFLVPITTLLTVTCTVNKEEFKLMQLLKDSVKLQVPINWTVIDTIPKLHDFDLIDKVYLGTSNGYAGSVTIISTQSSNILLSEYLEGEKIELQDKNPFAILIAESLNKNENSVRIDFSYKNNNISYYAIEKTYRNANKKVKFYFQLEDSPKNRRVLISIIESIQIVE